MDFKLEKTEVTMCNIESASGEQTFEKDLLLPDYYEDIMKILKCTATPVISKTNIVGEKIIIDGIINVRIYYHTTENKIKSIISKIEFSKDFDIKNNFDNIYISSKVNLDYINCRAINERKIDIKGALSIKLNVFLNNKQNILCDAKGSGLQVNKNNIENMMVIGNNTQFTVKEDLELENNNPDIGNIIKYDIKPIINEKKVIENKVVCKGEVTLNILYNPSKEDDEDVLPTNVTFKIPINQIIDFNGLEENCPCELYCNVVWAEVVPKADSNGVNRYFAVEINFIVSTKLHKKLLSPMVTDSYSTLMDINCMKKVANCYQLVDQVDEKFSVEANVAVPYINDIKILDLWGTPKIVYTKKIDDKLNIEGKIELSILGLDNENVPIYIEKFIDFQKDIQIENIDYNDLSFDFNIEQLENSYNITYDNIDINFDLLLTGSIYKNSVENVITDIEVDTSKPKNRTTDDSLIVYYAQPGENIWELAKKYNTSISAILEENENIGDNIVKEKTMIVIPIVSN